MVTGYGGGKEYSNQDIMNKLNMSQGQLSHSKKTITNNIQKAKDYLNKAISNGFANYKKLQNQEELSILNINEFVEKIKNPQLN